jgi:hypothetical protein
MSSCGIGALCVSAGALLVGLYGLAQEPQRLDALLVLGLTLVGGTLTAILLFSSSFPGRATSVRG